MSSLLYRINFLCTSVRVLCNLYHPRSRINSIRRDKTLVVVHLWRRIRSWEHQKIYISLVVLPARDKGQVGTDVSITERILTPISISLPTDRWRWSPWEFSFVLEYIRSFGDLR